eukprot:TRINITY_DN1847_c0_g3_i1.p1 TRINITY_DN1847_c0_g3~~TRINITY_DN1847_c0_g3_i1.p1  ORF type:complete len:142 (-),score=20.50 TRINITY_DN1847_c0_g3_i1:414-839(-)
MTLQYLWIFIALGIVIVLTVINFVFLCCNAGHFSKSIDKRLGELMITLAGYPIIFAVAFVPLGTSRLLTGAGIDVPIEYNWVAIMLFVSNGFFNALYYGITRKIFRKWKLEFKGTTTRGKLSKSRSKSKSKETKERPSSRN